MTAFIARRDIADAYLDGYFGEPIGFDLNSPGMKPRPDLMTYFSGVIDRMKNHKLPSHADQLNAAFLKRLEPYLKGVVAPRDDDKIKVTAVNFRDLRFEDIFDK